MIKEEIMEEAMDINGTFLFEYDSAEDVISFSENMKKYIPYSQRVPSFLKQMETRGKVHPEDMQKAMEFFGQEGEEGKVRMQYIRFLNFDGDYPWYQLKGRLFPDDGGKHGLFCGTYTYLDEEKKLTDDLLDTSSKDPLTKLYNKEKTYEMIGDYFKVISNDAIPNLMIIDIDDFKSLNETYGILEGDGIVMEVARILRRAFRASDIIGRLDGDEFVVSMKSVASTAVLADRAAFVVQEVKRIWKTIETRYSTSVSIGVAAMDPGRGDLEELSRKADYALASAKMNGKNTYVVYSGSLHGEGEFRNSKISGKEMELVHNMLEPLGARAYIVDEEYDLVYANQTLRDKLGDLSGICYSVLKGYSESCPDCPRKRMRQGETTHDSIVYSPSLRTTVPVRTITLRLRTGKKLFIIAEISTGQSFQALNLERSTERINRSVFMLQDIIWDVNLTKNTCIRIKENNIAANQEERKVSFQEHRSYFRENVVHPEDREEFAKLTDPVRIKEEMREGRDAFRAELRFMTVSGDYLWHSISVLPDEKKAAGAAGDTELLVMCQNIDDFKRKILAKYELKRKFDLLRQQDQYQREIILSNERYEHVNELTGILVYEYNILTGETYLCSNFEEVFGKRPESKGGPFELLTGLKPHEDDKRFYEEFLQKAREGADANDVTCRLYNRYGAPVWFTVIVQPYYGINNKPVRYLCILQNVNKEMKLKAEMEYRADYDSMTGLFNSDTFYYKASERMHLYKDKRFAIVVLDIDRFRLINDRYGVEEGNRTLENLGRIIRNALPRGAIASRYQGDKFQVMMSYEEEQNILDMIRDIVLNNSKENTKYKVKLSFGIYTVNNIELPVRLMCDRARLAQTNIKGNALEFYSFYNDKIRLQLREQQEMEEEMQIALDNHEFVMFLQPKYSLKTEKMCGAEALVRWKHPTKGLRYPNSFLPLFENNGFITKLDLYMWEEACKFIVKMKEMGAVLPVSVNISRVNVHNTDLAVTMLKLVEQYGIEPKLLELEITESLFAEDVTELFGTMEALKREGFVIEMDDFGSGYSSLNMLRSAPMDVLKIDRFFLDEIMGTERGRIIVENSIRMAKQLNLTVVAEGVETRDQVDFLKRVECDIAQGYYFSRPIDTLEFEKLLRNNI